jgi:hypothetical protein
MIAKDKDSMAGEKTPSVGVNHRDIGGYEGATLVE